MLEALIFQTFQKDLRNLALQERRLRSQLKADTAEVRRLQAERQEKEQEAQKKTDAPKAAPAPNGFEFSTPEITPSPNPTPSENEEIQPQTSENAA
jgi:hypothetical protein